jgi:hypothetical protein
MIANTGGLDLEAYALVKLREIRGDLLCARVSTLQLSLPGAHADELVEKIADTLNLVGRLIEGDFE